MNDEEQKTDLERVEEFYRLLTDHEIPEGYFIPNLPPKMTGDQAFSLIWFLQSGLFLPDNIERCDGCGDLVDTDGEHVEFVESKKQRLCESCYRSEHAYQCCSCENHDFHESPGRLAVMTEEVQGMKPGLYRITDWPFYADGMIEFHLFDHAVERVSDLPQKVDTGEYPMGFLCRDCEQLYLEGQPPA